MPDGTLQHKKIRGILLFSKGRKHKNRRPPVLTVVFCFVAYLVVFGVEKFFGGKGHAGVD